MPNLNLVHSDRRVVTRSENLDDYEPLFIGSQAQLDTYWPQAEVHLKRVVEEAMCGEMDTQDLYEAVREKRMQCLVLKCDAGEMPDVALVLVFELIGYPKFAALNITAIGGRRLGHFKERFWKHVCSWAFMNGVRMMQAMVSPAMARVLKSYGFEPVYTVLRMPLTEM